ncbi:methylated-DNA--[protein]-cysteine S-methyltransferase [Candidatus Poribacteria bacterium]|nr:methylated-DNA--[protein]-cysteine S-methyltransferase [Candidatus Poribacteria bacterium]
MPLIYSYFEASWGWMSVTATEIGLYSLCLPKPTMQESLNTLPSEGILLKDNNFKEIKYSLVHYFIGEKANFDYPLDLTGYTDFQRSVLETTAKIPFGDLRSYGWIAEKIGKPRASRAVGQALGSNRLPIVIPCHRVVRSDGTLGGFSAGLGLKEKLIKLERTDKRSS